MGKKSQRKGANGERELTSILQGYGYATERGGSETFGTIPDVVGLPGIHIECKRTERLDLLGAMQQAQRDAVKFNDGKPAVFHRKNRSPWLVTMNLQDWLSLYRRFSGEETGEMCNVNRTEEEST